MKKTQPFPTEEQDFWREKLTAAGKDISAPLSLSGEYLRNRLPSQKKRMPFLKWAVPAACCACAVLLVLTMLPRMNSMKASAGMDAVSSMAMEEADVLPNRGFAAEDAEEEAAEETFMVGNGAEKPDVTANGAEADSPVPMESYEQVAELLGFRSLGDETETEAAWDSACGISEKVRRPDEEMLLFAVGESGWTAESDGSSVWVYANDSAKSGICLQPVSAVQELAAWENLLAVVTAPEGRMQAELFDFSDPANPKSLGLYGCEGSLYALFSQTDGIYAAVSRPGVCGGSVCPLLYDNGVSAELPAERVFLASPVSREGYLILLALPCQTGETLTASAVFGESNPETALEYLLCRE